MAEAGRLFRVKLGTTVIAGAREEDIAFARALVDTTSKTSAKNRELLAGEGTLSTTVNCTGVFTDGDTLGLDAVRTAMLAGTSDTYKIDHVSGDAYDGDFMVENMSVGSSNEGTVTFTFTLQSNGAVTFTAAI